MMLPTFRLRLIPGARCEGCGRLGYVHDRTRGCLLCMHAALTAFAKRKPKGKAKEARA